MLARGELEAWPDAHLTWFAVERSNVIEQKMAVVPTSRPGWIDHHEKEQESPESRRTMSILNILNDSVTAANNWVCFVIYAA